MAVINPVVDEGSYQGVCHLIRQCSSHDVLYLASRLPMLMLPCSQPAALAAAIPAGRAGRASGAGERGGRAGRASGAGERGGRAGRASGRAGVG